MSLINDNIKYFRHKQGRTLLDIADYLGVKEATVQRYESGAIKNIKYETIQKLASYFNCTPAELMGWSDDTINFSNYDIRPANKRKIPHLGKIACGVPIYANAEDNYIEVDSDEAIDFALTASGDSMTGANINDGDIIFLKKQSTVENGEIAAVVIEDEVTLKRVYKSNDRLILNAENKAYEPMVFEGSQLEQIFILGKAVICQFKIK